MNSRSKTVVCSLTIVLMTASAFAQAKKTVKAGPVSDEMPAATGRDAYVRIDQFPKTGRQSTLAAPSLAGATIIGNCYTKPRKWIVLEAKYTTLAKFQDQLTFTWHVLLDTKTATEKEKSDKIPPYSYFTTTTTYYNIPKGSHAASVCLHPSYLERFGEPKAIGLVIANKNGEVLAGDCESDVKGISTHPKSLEAAFWNDQKIMNATDAAGEPMIERRQGLLDRAKTIWALVNPNDYETTIQ